MALPSYMYGEETDNTNQVDVNLASLTDATGDKDLNDIKNLEVCKFDSSGGLRKHAKHE